MSERWEDEGWQRATARLRLTRKQLASYPQTESTHGLRQFIDTELAQSLLTPHQRMAKRMRNLLRGKR